MFETPWHSIHLKRKNKFGWEGELATTTKEDIKNTLLPQTHSIQLYQMQKATQKHFDSVDFLTTSSAKLDNKY
jgi:hypothetical protein